MAIRGKGPQGFTLLELLVVMFIIGLVFSFATLSLTSGTRPYQIKTAAKRLYALTSLALEEAILTGSQLGLRFDFSNSMPGVSGEPAYIYQWLYYDTEADEWYLIQQHEVLNEGKLPEDLLLEVEIEGQALIIGAKKEKKKSIFAAADDDEQQSLLDEEEKAQQLAPDIYFLSSGEIVAFSIKISEALVDSPEDNPVYEIKGEMVGKIEFIEPGDEEEI